MPDADDLFGGSPPLKLERRLALSTADRPPVTRRIAAFLIVAWLPLLLLSLWEDLRGPGTAGFAFLSDLGTWARCFVCAPLLIRAEGSCVDILSKLARKFDQGGFVQGEDRARLARAAGLIRRWRGSRLAEILVATLAYAMSLLMLTQVPLAGLPSWHRLEGETPALSAAGWWYALVSHPLLLMLLLGWVWRLLMWATFLALVARLDLQLVPVHPDKAAGLGFVAYSVRAFGTIGAAIGALAAGTIANQLAYGGAALLDFRYSVPGLVLAVVLLFTAPLLAFTPKLIQTWRRGFLEYGALADTLGRQFEREWLAHRRSGTSSDIAMLDRPDFSAATDLYQVVDRIHEMRIVPVDLLSVVILAGATFLPFIPVILMAVPFDAVVGAILAVLR